ncbi:gphn protein [Capsaspora owczarzaki ATCC 30864]|uniref:Gphn protein n=1 Tax=Capsaspora owczarzaki (strain ATCC 30864) TaxID=595528 RepID=A0A0D2VKU4_CAPO3|nr:gphn protein [Capsaspora owczarzaki ATCC 30864]
MATAMRVGVLTVSDSCADGTAVDTSGPNLCALLRSSGLAIQPEIHTALVRDERDDIAVTLKQWADQDGLRLILTTGGTGLAPRDATLLVIEREAPAIAQLMLIKSLEITPLAALSRARSGVRGKTLIVNLPGSKKASAECFQFILPILGHALDLIAGHAKQVKQTHAVLAQHPPLEPVPAEQSSATGPSAAGHSHAIAATQQQQQPQQHQHAHHHHSCDHHTDRFASDVSDDWKTLKSADPAQVARRQRHSPFPLFSVEEAQRIVQHEAAALLENLPLVELSLVDQQPSILLGHVCAKAVIAATPIPAFRASVKDGYAVLAADGEGVFAVVGGIAAGDAKLPAPLQSGQIARITTGAALPEGADAVVQVEDTELVEATADGQTELRVRILKRASGPGQDVRAVGSDIAVGECVLDVNSVIGPAELGLLASVGVTKVTAFAKPTMGILSTGNEVVSIDTATPLGPNQIRDSNRITLLAAAAEAGLHAKDFGIIQDDFEVMALRIKQVLNEVDVLVTTGGVSMGEKDLLKPVLDSLGATLHFGRVYMKPGKPTTLFTVKHNGRSKLIFGLPGNPVSALVTFHLYVVPSMRQMARSPHPNAPIVRAELAFPLRLDTRPEYHRVTLTYNHHKGKFVAASTGSQCSSRLLSVRSANGLLILPPRTTALADLPVGYEVDAMLLGHVL